MLAGEGLTHQIPHPGEAQARQGVLEMVCVLCLEQRGSGVQDVQSSSMDSVCLGSQGRIVLYRTQTQLDKQSPSSAEARCFSCCCCKCHESVNVCIYQKLFFSTDPTNQLCLNCTRVER